MTNGIILRYAKTIRPISLEDTICTGQLDTSSINGIYNRGTGSISRECDYQWNGITISMYAWVNGQERYINQHDLPPPVDNELYYGDIIVIKHDNGVMGDLSVDEYNKFYEDSFGGFDDILSDESVSSDESPTQSDIDFIVSDHESDEGNSSDEEEAMSDSPEESDSGGFNSDELTGSSTESLKLTQTDTDNC
jgi:hypothetical protein